MLMFSLTSSLLLIAITLIISKCSIIYQKVNNLTSNNRQINLTQTYFSNNFMVGVSNDSVIYKSVLSNNNMFEMERMNIPNLTFLNIYSIQIKENQSRGISATMIINQKNITTFNGNNTKINFINSTNGYRIKGAVFGEKASEIYVYQMKCEFFQDQSYVYSQIQTVRIQKYSNSTLINETTLFGEACTYYDLKKMSYSQNTLFIQFTNQLVVYNTTTFQKLFIHNSTFQQSYMYLDMSLGSNYLVFNYGPSMYIASLSNWALTCTFNQDQGIISTETVQSYTFYTTLTKIVQFDNDICEIIDQLQLPTANVIYQIQYSHLTKQLILRQQCWYDWYTLQYIGNTFMYLYSFDYGYLSNSRSCLPTYGYLAGRCIKKYGRSQPPPRPPPPKQISPITNISTVKSASPTSTLQTMIIPITTLTVSVLISYLAYLLIFHCFNFYKIKGKEKENQKWWETVSESKDKNHQP